MEVRYDIVSVGAGEKPHVVVLRMRPASKESREEPEAEAEQGPNEP